MIRYRAMCFLLLSGAFLTYHAADAQKIFAAGRGLMAEGTESAAEVVALSGKSNPTVLYLGTASYDKPANKQVDTKHYKTLGCDVRSLRVAWSAPPASELRTAFAAADIILIAGGNTLFAVDRWAKLGMDRMIKSAVLHRDVVIAGGSAGFISLCNGGHSDSMKPESFKSPVGPLLNPAKEARDAIDRSWEYIRVPGLGIIDMLCCPHYDTTQNNGVPRAKDFTSMLRRHGGEYAIAVDEWAALVVDGDTYRVTSRENRTGSVGPNNTFAPRSKGRPGIWALSVDSGTGEVKRSVVPTKGKVSDVIRPPRWITDDPMVMIARAQNPDDGRPAAWTNPSDTFASQQHLFAIFVAVFALVGAILMIALRKIRSLNAQGIIYEQVEAS